MANLNHGTLDGTRIITEEAYEELWKPNVDAAPNRGLSWSLQEIDGHRVVQHMGSDRGFRSGLILFPDLKLGIAIVTNTDRVPFDAYVKTAILDSLAAATH